MSPESEELMDAEDESRRCVPEIELRFRSVGDDFVLERWTLVEGIECLVAESAGARQFNWRGAGPRRFVLPLVRLARWRSLEAGELPKEIPLLDGRGRSNAAALFGDLQSSAGKVKWISEMLSFSDPPCPKDAVARLKRWFCFENVQGKRASERVRVSANSEFLAPECVDVFLNDKRVNGEQLDQLEARLSWMADGGSLPPWPWGGRAELTGYVPCTATACEGRERELANIDALYDDDAEVRMLVVTGKAGEGKTTVGREWVIRRCLAGTLREEVVFGWSFYRQGHGGGAQMLAKFWSELSQVLEVELDDGMLPIERAQAIILGIEAKSIILFLDGLEVLLDADSLFAFDLVDESLAEILSYLVSNDKGWVIATSREPLRECKLYGFPKVQHLRLEQQIGDLAKLGGLSEMEALTALEHQLFIANFGGALDELNLAVAVGDGSDRDALARLVRGTLERLQDSPERVILLAASFFERPPEWEYLLAFVKAEPPIKGLDGEFDRGNNDVWEFALLNLQSKKVIQVESDGRIWIHPRIAEIIADEVRRSSPLSWVKGHLWLADYLAGIPKSFQPDSIIEMEPLFRAIWHGCRAGEFRKYYEEIASPRILRDNVGYVLMVLGAYQETLDMTRLFSPDHATFPTGCDLDAEQRAQIISVSAAAYRFMGRPKLAYDCQQRAWELIPADGSLHSVGPIALHLLRCQHIFGKLSDSKPIIRRLISLMMQSPVTAGRLKVSPEIVAKALGYIAVSVAFILRARGQWIRAGVYLNLAHKRIAQLLNRPLHIFPGFCAILHGILLLDDDRWEDVEAGLRKGDIEPFPKRCLEIAGEELLRGRTLSAKALTASDKEAPVIATEALSLLNKGLQKVEAKRLTWYQCNFLFAIAVHHARQGRFAQSKEVGRACLEIAREEQFRLFECDASLLIAAIDQRQLPGEVAQMMKVIGYKPKLEKLLAGIQLERREYKS